MGSVLLFADSWEGETGGRASHGPRASFGRPVHVHATRSPTDAELVERIRDDDGDALAELARRYLPRLGTIAYAVVGADDLAQDVVQEVLIALWEQRSRLDPDANISGYLARATRNRALNLLRHERVVHRAHEQSTHDGTYDIGSVVNAGEARLGAADVRNRVYAVLRHMPSGPREVFLLSWEHDLTYAEIASTLGMTVANVRQQMHRAVRRLAGRFFREK